MALFRLAWFGLPLLSDDAKAGDRDEDAMRARPTKVEVVLKKQTNSPMGVN